MRKVWKRGRRSKRGGREEEEEDKKVEEKGKGRSNRRMSVIWPAIPVAPSVIYSS